MVSIRQQMAEQRLPALKVSAHLLSPKKTGTQILLLAVPALQTVHEGGGCGCVWPPAPAQAH
jgi:hypothetical protein